jgi:hypothetical protein
VVYNGIGCECVNLIHVADDWVQMPFVVNAVIDLRFT